MPWEKILFPFCALQVEKLTPKHQITLLMAQSFNIKNIAHQNVNEVSIDISH